MVFVVFLLFTDLIHTCLVLLSTTILANPLIDIVKNKVQIKNDKSHPQDTLIHLLRTDDLFSDDLHTKLLAKQSHLIFNVHYDQPQNSIFVNGGKIELNEQNVNTNEPLKPGPIIKVEGVKLSPEEMKESDEKKQELISKLPKGIYAAQLRLNEEIVNDDVKKIGVFIKVLEDNGENRHSFSPIFQLVINKHKMDEIVNPAQEVIDKARIEQQKHQIEAMGRLKSAMDKMHQKVFKLVGKPPHGHPHPPMVHLLTNEHIAHNIQDGIKVPMKGCGKHPHGPPHHRPHFHPHGHGPHPHPHHKPSMFGCLHKQLHKAVYNIHFRLSSLSLIAKLSLALACFGTFTTLFGLIHHAHKQRRQERDLYYSQLPAYEQVEIITHEDKE